MPTFSIDQLSDNLTRIFVQHGTSPEDAAIVVDHLIEAELCGVVSHGLIRVPQYVTLLQEGKIRPQATLTKRRSTPATAVLSGGHGFGQVMARKAMEAAIEMAGECGVGAASLVDCSHTGRLASYALQAVKRGMIGLVMVNAGGHGQWMAPHGGIAGRLATNPFAFAAPAGDNDPIVLDIATSIVPEGKIRSALNEQTELPAGWIIDHNGIPSTNPRDLYGPPRGAILPFGGHKGFGLAMMIEILAGALSGAGCCQDAAAPLAGTTDGVFLLAINVGSFCPLDQYCVQIESLARHIRSSPPASGSQPVILPGELEATIRQCNLTDGLDIADSTWSQIEPLLFEA